MRCPKCDGLTRVDHQSLLDTEGERYRRACVTCGWDAWEPELRLSPAWTSLVLALDEAIEIEEEPAERELLAIAS